VGPEDGVVHVYDENMARFVAHIIVANMQGRWSNQLGPGHQESQAPVALVHKVEDEDVPTGDSNRIRRLPW